MYDDANLHFYQLSYDYIDNDEYVQIDTYDELNALRNSNIIENSINIYIVNVLFQYFIKIGIKWVTI